MAQVTITDDDGRVFASHELEAGQGLAFELAAFSSAAERDGVETLLEDLATAQRNKARAAAGRQAMADGQGSGVTPRHPPRSSG